MEGCAFAFRVLKRLLRPIVSFHLTSGRSCGVGKAVLPRLFISGDIEAQLKACPPQGFGGKARSLDSTAPSAGAHRVQPGQVRASCSAGPCLVQCCAVTILKSSVLLSQEPCVCFLHGALQILLPVLLAAPWTPLWPPPRSQKRQHVWDQIPAQLAPSLASGSVGSVGCRVPGPDQAFGKHGQLLVQLHLLQNKLVPISISSSKSNSSKMSSIKPRGSWVFSDSM